jgi:enoyl-CoA hydratase
MGDLVSYQLTEGVATIVMDDGKVNALSPAMLAALNAALDQATSDGAVVILTGRTGIFSGGFDLSTLRGGGPEAALLLNRGLRWRSACCGIPLR